MVKPYVSQSKNIHVEIGKRRWETLSRDIDAFRSYMKGLTSEMLKQEGALAAKAFLMFSAPLPAGDKGASGHGLEIRAKKQGEKAAEFDIRLIFKSPKDGIFGAADPNFGSMAAFLEWKANGRPTGNDVLGRIWDDYDLERAYQKARNFAGHRSANATIMRSTDHMRGYHEHQRMKYRGRIMRHNGPDKEISKHPFIAKDSMIKQYVRQRIARVGWMKAPWADVIDKATPCNINGKLMRPGGFIPGWIRRHKGGGNGRIIHDKDRGRFKIINDVGDSDGISTNFRVVEKVIQYRQAQNSKNDWKDEAVKKAVERWNKESNANYNAVWKAPL